jgi:DNA invertase Pin-like site-specific DNA recombinase
MLGQRIGYIRVSTIEQNTERQREGIAMAKQRGAYKGQKKSLSEAAVTALHQRLTTGVTKAQVAREFGISRETLYQYLRLGT